MFPIDESELRKLRDIKTADTTKLAYIGDAVYELYVRGRALSEAGNKPNDMNRFSISFVKADSQAGSAKALLKEGLSDEEEAILKRARNRTGTSAPRGSSPETYKLATGFEALVGWLYVCGREGRMMEIMEKAMEVA